MLFGDRYISRFTIFIEQAQDDARNISYSINNSIPCKNLFADLSLSAEYLIKRFSDSYDEVKEAINVKENTDNVITLFLKNASEQKEKLVTIDDYREFSKFVKSETKSILEVIEDDSLPEIEVDFY